MKRLIVQGCRFLVLSLAIYLVTFLVMTKTVFLGRPFIYRTSDYYQYKGGVSYFKFEDWAKGGTYDLVVVGSSHAYKGYDPRVFEERGYHMFNLGSSAQTPLSTYAVLEAYVTKERAPFVIMDVYENAFDHPGIESVSELTHNMDDDRAALRLAASFRDIRGLNLFTLRMMDKGVPPTWVHTQYVGNGAAISPDSAGADVKYPGVRPFHMNERQLDLFLDGLDLCAERGIRVVLCSHFYPHQGERIRHAAFVHLMDSVLGRRPPADRPRWFDFAETPGIDDHDHFADHNHLNAAGARIFNERLIDSLVAHGYLPAR